MQDSRGAILYSILDPKNDNIRLIPEAKPQRIRFLSFIVKFLYLFVLIYASSKGATQRLLLSNPFPAVSIHAPEKVRLNPNLRLAK